ncbi:MAG: rod shape-determining protein RodA [Myxococcales bacterium]|nr:rod shape-determining protein RodA [Myxococcales bacterium]
MRQSDGLASRFDWPLFIAAVTIALLGVVNLYSATSVYGAGAVSERYITQLYWLLGSGIVGAVICAFDYRHIERYAYIVYAVSVFSLILVFVLGRDVRGAVRWIPIGSFQFQPSEFTKLCLVIALAKFLHDDPKNDGRSLKDLVIPALLTAVPAFLILRQPDLGTAMIHVFIFLTIAAVTKISLKSIILFVTTSAVGAYVAYHFVLLDYQRARVEVFLNPEADILGKGWHAHHARVAIGNGEVLGNGYLKGMQNQFLFLPDQSTDFPFPVWAEEWGFVGSTVMIGLYLFLCLWAIRIASQARDRFGAVLCVGATAMIFWHAVINISMTCGLMPVVGVTMPLFSYGGSSVSNTMLAVALLMSVSMRRNMVRPSAADLRY